MDFNMNKKGLLLQISQNTFEEYINKTKFFDLDV